MQSLINIYCDYRGGRKFFPGRTLCMWTSESVEEAGSPQHIWELLKGPTGTSQWDVEQEKFPNRLAWCTICTIWDDILSYFPSFFSDTQFSSGATIWPMCRMKLIHIQFRPIEGDVGYFLIFWIKIKLHPIITYKYGPLSPTNTSLTTIFWTCKSWSWSWSNHPQCWKILPNKLHHNQITTTGVHEEDSLQEKGKKIKVSVRRDKERRREREGGDPPPYGQWKRKA